MKSVNVDGTAHVVEACLAAGVRRLVYTSSASVVFDGRDLKARCVCGGGWGGVGGQRFSFTNKQGFGRPPPTPPHPTHAHTHTLPSPTPTPSSNPPCAQGVDESQPYAARPLDYYTQTKIEGERLALAANGRGGLATVALRPSGIFGEHDLLTVPSVVGRWAWRVRACVRVLVFA